jgi:alkylation response protein AidB-like acyl-CoA dehydrogenase
MPRYMAPIEDMRFLLEDLFAFDSVMAELGFDIDLELAVNVLAEAGKFCSEVLNPLNRPGDMEGSRLEHGVVRTPKGFATAYRSFVEAGWPSLSGSPEYGGQGLPITIGVLVNEMVSAANLSFGLFPGLTRGAVEAIHQHASEQLKAHYLPKLISGQWTGVMALTESNSGTDLGLLRTRAEPQKDGSYKVTGTKIFISSGDHDFGGNIVHLVLARLQDAPAGVKGISLFLVPKFLTDLSGNLGPRNDVVVDALEEKMGIHAQPTCVINYDGATGWLVGELNRGLSAMFTMMNSERLFVGIQGLGIGEAAYQGARAYARERLQGKSLDGTRGPVPIIEHPDVRKMLLTIRALTEAGRALAVWTGLQFDRAATHADGDQRAEADGFVALLTPVLKAALTDFGFESAVLAQQVFGGHGYIAEWGMEQLVRDARIAQIYEGTNGIQAHDLVDRKLMSDNGRLVFSFLAHVKKETSELTGTSDSEDVVARALAAIACLHTATDIILQNSKTPGWTGAAATDYLRLFSIATYGWLWAKMAVKAVNLKENNPKFYTGKLKLAQFFADRILPQTMALEAAIVNGPSSILAFENDLV